MADHLTNYLPLVVVKVIFQVDVENIVVYYDVCGKRTKIKTWEQNTYDLFTFPGLKLISN